MRFVYAFALLVAAATTVLANEDWENYKNNHGKSYEPGEEAIRAAHFLKTDAVIKAHNKGNAPFKMEHNKFSDMDEDEKQNFLGAKVHHAAENAMAPEMEVPSTRAIPASLDLRTDVCMSPIRNQASCGSCWAFTAIAPLEFSYCKAHGNVKVDLSEQQLVDCSTANSGCNGGWFTSAWSYLTAGSVTEKLYPYVAIASKCKMTTSLTPTAKVASMYGYYRNNTTAMQTAMQTYGPLAVAIHVTSPFYNYKSGVYSDTTCDKTGKTVNHGVVAVGWGTDTTTKLPYWIVRNSWGTGWGASGYILMKRGVNMCNIEYYPAAVKAA